MAFVVAIQPDSEQAATLVRVLNGVPDLEVMVVRSKDAALELVDKRVPDVVLVDPLLGPGDDEHLGAYLRARPSAAHVQVLTIPNILDVPREVVSPRRFGRMRQKGASVTPGDCAPHGFASDIVGYVSWAQTLKETFDDRKAFERQRRPDRRRAYRWSLDDLPWVTSVQMPGGEPASIVDVSSGGALIRTWQRPGRNMFRRGDRHLTEHRSLRLRLKSGEEIPIAGQVIRCCVATNEDEGRHYEVAFRFDHPASAFIPATPNSFELSGNHEATTLAIALRGRKIALRDNMLSPALLSLSEFMSAIDRLTRTRP